MGVSKVVIDDRTVIDLTSDTVTAAKLVSGYTAHGADGEEITGTLITYPMTPYYYDYNIGYVDNGTWKYENPTRTYCDIYEVLVGHTYFISLGNTVGSRFRAMYTTENVVGRSTNATGTKIINTNSPPKLSSAYYTVSDSNGYIIVAKDNVGVSGLKTYVFDASEW